MQLALPVDTDGLLRAASATGLADHTVPGKAGFPVELQVTNAGCRPLAAELFVIHGAGIGAGGAECAARVREIQPGNAGQGMFGRVQPDDACFAGCHAGMCAGRTAGVQWQPVMPGRGRAKRLPAL